MTRLCACIMSHKYSYQMLPYRVGSLVSDRISRSSSLDKKKNLGKKRRFFSRYSLSPLRISSKNSLHFLIFSNILSTFTTASTCLSWKNNPKKNVNVFLSKPPPSDAGSLQQNASLLQIVLLNLLSAVTVY